MFADHWEIARTAGVVIAGVPTAARPDIPYSDGSACQATIHSWGDQKAAEPWMILQLDSTTGSDTGQSGGV
jgi:hypothetical protein